LPWFVEFGDGVGIHDVLEDDAVVDHVVVDHVVVVDGVEDEDGGDDDEQAMEQKCLDSEAKDYDELMPRMALNLELDSAAT
jgi:hypothetical protein